MDSVRNSYYTIVASAFETPNKEVILVGAKLSANTCNKTQNENSLFFRRYNAAGSLISEKNFFSPCRTYPTNVVVDEEGCFYLALKMGVSEWIEIDGVQYPGFSAGHYGYLIKFDFSGKALWVRGDQSMSVRTISIDKAGNVYLLGHIGQQACITKYAADGNKLLRFNHPYHAGQVVVDGEGNIFGSWGEGYNSYISKYSPAGALNFVITYNFGQTRLAAAKSGVYVLFDSYAPGPAELAKIDKNGNTVWSQPSILPGVGGGLVIRSDSHDQIFIAGSRWDTLRVACYSPLGVLSWSLTDIGNSLYAPVDIRPSGDRCYLACNSNLEIPYAHLFRIDLPANPLLNVKDEMSENRSLSIYPNPSSSIFHICFQPAEAEPLLLSVYDATGRLVISRRMPACTQLNEAIDLKGQPKGVYLVEVYGTRTREVRRLLLE